jgi:hypothetical protein
VPYDPGEVAKLKTVEDSGLVAQLVPKGYIGIWNKTLAPGQYYLNRDAFDVKFIDTRVQTWKYLGGYKRRYIDLQVGQDGKIEQKEWDETFPVPKDAADQAISSRIEGWLVPIDLRVLIQVTPENAPFVVATVGDIKEVEDKILTPTIRSVVRNVTGSVEKFTEEGGQRKVLDLIEKREEIETAIETKIIPDRSLWLRSVVNSLPNNCRIPSDKRKRPRNRELRRRRPGRRQINSLNLSGLRLRIARRTFSKAQCRRKVKVRSFV